MKDVYRFRSLPAKAGSIFNKIAKWSECYES